MNNIYYVGTHDGEHYGIHISPEKLKEGFVQLSQDEYDALMDVCRTEGKILKYEKGKKPIAVDYVIPEDKKLQKERSDLQWYLSETDYIAAKLAEGVATKEEYATELQKRQLARDRINEIDKLLS